MFMLRLLGLEEEEVELKGTLPMIEAAVEAVAELYHAGPIMLLTFLHH